MLGETNRNTEFSFCPLDFCRINCYLHPCFLVQQISAFFQVRAKDTPAKHPWSSVPSYFPRQPHLWGPVCSSAQTRSLLCCGEPVSPVVHHTCISRDILQQCTFRFCPATKSRAPRQSVWSKQQATTRIVLRFFSASFYLQNTGISIKQDENRHTYMLQQSSYPKFVKSFAL